MSSERAGENQKSDEKFKKLSSPSERSTAKVTCYELQNKFSFQCCAPWVREKKKYKKKKSLFLCY